MAEVKIKYFLKDIQEQLFADNSFVKMSVSHDAFVNGKTVEIPQAGSIPSVKEDRSVLPAQISQRTDDTKSYDLIEFTTDPILVPNVEAIQNSYDKRRSIMAQHVNKLNDRIGSRCAFQWAGADLVSNGGQIIVTTGTAVAGIAPDGATGNRKPVLLADIANLAKKFDKDNMPQRGRKLLMPSDMYHNMLITNTVLQSREYTPSSEAIERGVVKVIWGFEIMVRPTVVTYTQAGTPVLKDIDAAVAPTDNHGAIAWQEDYVAKALGQTKFFVDRDNPAYYGDVMSALVMFNATKLRSDGKGIATLVQGQ